jgi:hypothetical protein
MHMYTTTLIAAALTALAALASPAVATTLSQAQQLCKQNPNCIQTKGAGGSNFTVGNNEVWCPNKGNCECLACAPPARMEGTVVGSRGTVAGTLATSPGKPSLSDGIFGGGLLQATPGFSGQGPAPIGTPGPASTPGPIIIR